MSPGSARDGPGYRGLYAILWALARALFRLTVTGRERIPGTGGAVIAANHQSWLDPIIVALALPRKPAFLAMQELWAMPAVRPALRAYGPLAIPLQRGAVDATALRRALQVLQDGHLLIVFPEGGISPDGHLRPFHRGAAMLAARAHVPLIPVALDGTSDALPLDRILPRPRPITVRIGTPIEPAGTGREDLARASAAAEAEIERLRAPRR
jgi:1-acyl-sn-glycerol-3-phosphate acyltransferase